MICWYCYWGWPKPVKEIHDQATERLGGNDDALQFGPGHIVWSDENFEDHNIQWCLNEIANNRLVYELGDDEISIVKESLERLLLIPETERAEPEDYDGEHPELFPPKFGVVSKCSDAKAN